MNAAPIAALTYTDDSTPELRILWQAAALMRGRGLTVLGLLNRLDGNRNADREIICSLSDGRRYRIMQDLGRTEAAACLLDPRGLAEAGAVIREALENPPDVLVFNKFGSAEAQGRGLAQEYLDAAMAGIPLISLVQDKYAGAWHDFTGNSGVLLEKNADAVLAWALANRKV